MPNDSIEWDFFLAHAGADVGAAEALYDQLAKTSRVFLDSRCLILGDDWDAALAAAQRRALISVVLISKNTSGTYYQREEVAAAIALAREAGDRHRVVPLYLEGDPTQADVPYGLRLKHGISLGGGVDLGQAAARLLDLRRVLDGKRAGSSETPGTSRSQAGQTPPAPEASPGPMPSPQDDSPDVLFEQGEALYVNGDFDGAYERFLRAAEQEHLSSIVALGFMHWLAKGCEKSSSKATSWFRYAAERYDPRAHEMLGVICKSSNDPEEYVRAARHFRFAAEHGLASAQGSLGVLYLVGRGGVEQNFAEARKWYQLAADQGDATAMANLSELYEKGLGMPKDPVKAATLDRRAKEQLEKRRSGPAQPPWRVRPAL